MCRGPHYKSDCPWKEGKGPRQKALGGCCQKQISGGKKGEEGVQENEAVDKADEIDVENVFGYWTSGEIVDFLRGEGEEDLEGKVKEIVKLYEKLNSKGKHEE